MSMLPASAASPTVQMTLEKELRRALVQAGIDERVVATLPLDPSPPSIEGDFGLPCFSLAKDLHKAPPAIAQELAAKINADVKKLQYIDRFVAVGPYLNVVLNKESYCQAVVNEVLTQAEGFGQSDVGQHETVIVDMSSPNIAKRMSVGHLRSTIIGDALARAYHFVGFHVIKDNHLGDWGTQFGHLLYAIEQWGDEQAIEKDPIPELQKLYVRVSKAGEADEAVKNAGRAWFKKLEDGDPHARALWQKIVDWSLQDFQKIYDILGVTFDVMLGESFYEPMLPATIKAVEESGQAVVSQGALIFDLEDQKLGIAIVRKADGATMYLTRDIATATYRVKHFHAHRMIYVVGEDQKMYFQQFFAVLKKLGYPIAEHCVHVYFGMVSLKEGKMSTRKGRVILLEDVINEATKRAAAMIAQSTKTQVGKEKDALVRQIAVGALKWNDLSKDPRMSVVFDWDAMLSMKGDSAPYVQYAHARAASVLKKFDKNIEPQQVHVTEVAELTVVKDLAHFPVVVQRVVETNSPAVLATYLYELAQHFNSFYHDLTILNGSETEKTTRVAICAGVAQTIRNGLQLLGIEAPQRM